MKVWNSRNNSFWIFITIDNFYFVICKILFQEEIFVSLLRIHLPITNYIIKNANYAKNLPWHVSVFSTCLVENANLFVQYTSKMSSLKNPKLNIKIFLSKILPQQIFSESLLPCHYSFTEPEPEPENVPLHTKFIKETKNKIAWDSSMWYLIQFSRKERLTEKRYVSLGDWLTFRTVSLGAAKCFSETSLTSKVPIKTRT